MSIRMIKKYKNVFYEKVNCLKSANRVTGKFGNFWINIALA